MPSSRFLIASNTLGSSAASVTFSGIPATYTDLVLKVSARGSTAAVRLDCLARFNSTTTNYSETNLYASGTTVTSNRDLWPGYAYLGNMNGANGTSNTFSNLELYIPSYTASQNKPASNYVVQENNSTTNNEWYVQTAALLWRNTAAITSILIQPESGNFVSGSTFWLYGLKNS